jgi:DegV family protein with EDD domain
MTVQIVTDTASDLAPSQAAAANVTIVPLQVLIGGHNYRDRFELQPERFYALMREHKDLPKTSLPAPSEMMAAYKDALARGPVLGIHVSSALSGTYQGAVIAAQSVSGQIRVFDTLNGSGGTALMVLEAARMAREGASIDAIWQRLEQMRSEMKTLVALHTLENAVRGGRVSPLAGMAAKLLHVKPVVHVDKEGKVVPIDRVRGWTKALDRLLDMAAEIRHDWQDRVVAVAHGNARAEAEAFAQRVRERFSPKEVLFLEIGAAIGTYSAEGAILFSF